tara:strand:- start:102 stop:545 length:444 start_codon:yes stop_codon:yes gene_type:complete
MLMGLGEPPKKEGTDRILELKMSKSKPDTAIFMTDSEEEIKRKIKKAYCPEKVIEENPILEYCKYILFEKFKSIEIERPEKFGGNISLESYVELEKSFSKGDLHPMDLKTAVSEYLNKVIDPVRTAFTKNSKLKKLRETINQFEITR